jgi:hypothetical protein
MRDIDLRDYFAAKAMHAELATAGMDQEAANALEDGAVSKGRTILEHIAANAYEIADAMLKERSK